MRDRLYRSRTDRMLFGVAGGMARYLNLDPAIVRIVWVLLFLAVGTGVLLYIVAAVVIPEEPAGYVPPAARAGLAGTGVDASPNARPDLGNGPIIFGVVLVLVGGWLLLQRFVRINTADVWPILVIGLGVILVIGSLRGRGRS